MNDRKLYQKLNPYQDRVEIRYLQHRGRRIRYVDVGDPEKRMVLFIHGAPGSLEAFMGFLRDPVLRQNFRMMAFDRPGYGLSDPGSPITSLISQASIIQPLLDQNRNHKKPILIGHSYGGPVAASLAMQVPDQVGGLLLVGAAVDPDHEKIFWISHLIRFSCITAVLPASIISSNIEKLTHAEELKKISAGWKEITAPVTILHGKNDWIVPVINAFYIDRMLINAPKKMVIKNRIGHLIPWTHPRFIKHELLEMAERD